MGRAVMGLNLNGREGAWHKIKKSQKKQKWPKNTKNAFFACFWAYVGQPHEDIDWATSMPFASINFTNPRTNPWHFHKKMSRVVDFEKLNFFQKIMR